MQKSTGVSTHGGRPAVGGDATACAPHARSDRVTLRHGVGCRCAWGGGTGAIVQNTTSAGMYVDLECAFAIAYGYDRAAEQLNISR